VYQTKTLFPRNNNFELHAKNEKEILIMTSCFFAFPLFLRIRRFESHARVFYVVPASIKLLIKCFLVHQKKEETIFGTEKSGDRGK
jgi:hypothetical protein